MDDLVSDESSPRVLTERVEAVQVLTLNRPAALNAMDTRMTVELLAQVREALDDSGVRALVLTGAGRGFCAGGDTREVTEPFVDAEAEFAWTLEHARVTALLQSSGKPVVAAINGPCAGFGLSLAAACDIRLAAPEAVFVTAYVGARMSGDGGIARNLARLVGPGRAHAWMLLSPRIGADEARNTGLVLDVLGGPDLVRQAVRLAAQLAEAPSTVTAGIKANYHDMWDVTQDEYLVNETRRHVACKREQQEI